MFVPLQDQHGDFDVCENCLAVDHVFILYSFVTNQAQHAFHPGLIAYISVEKLCKNPSTPSKP